MKKWISIWLLSISSLAIIGLFNYIIDPYVKIGHNILHLKVQGVYDHRRNKFLYLDTQSNQMHYKAFILGSSRAMQLQPSIVEKATGYKTFNYSVYTATPEDYLSMTKHIIAKQDPKLIILHLDFYAFNKFMQPVPEFYNSPMFQYFTNVHQKHNYLYFPKSYLSSTALQDSFKVVDKNFHYKGEKLYPNNGANTPEYHNHDNYKLLTEYWDKEYKDFTISNERITYLKEIKRLCDLHNIKLLVSLSPVAYKHYKKIQTDKSLKQNIQPVKDELCKIFGQYIDFFTDSTIKFKDPKLWRDSVHPGTILGNILTKDIIETKNYEKKFGKLVICQ